MDYIGILIGASLVNNYVIGKMMGITPFIASPKNLASSFFMGLSITFVLFMSSIITYPLYNFIILPMGIEFLDLLFYTLFVLILMTVTYRVIEHFFKGIYKTIGVYFPIIMFNSTLFGIVFESTNNKYTCDFPSYLIYSIGSGLGYTVALILMSMLRNRIPDSKLPESLKGAPITLICAGIISMLFQLFGKAIPLI